MCSVSFAMSNTHILSIYSTVVAGFVLVTSYTRVLSPSILCVALLVAMYSSSHVLVTSVLIFLEHKVMGLLALHA